VGILSVDVEDYFHVEAFSDRIDRSTWDSYECRVEENTRRLLDLLDECHVHGTFFILGWVADRFPGLIREIGTRGHELACHSYWHRLIYELDREEFRADTLRGKNAIEQAAGVRVHGYRAPSYSVTSRSLWALDVLAEAGFTYDSSIFPIRHDVYGIPHAPRSPFRIQTSAGPLTEYPITTFRMFGRNLPVGGGGYLRILPLWYTEYGVKKALTDGVPLIVYVHPWELDAAQPRLPGRLKSRLRHYTNLRTTEPKLRAILGARVFTSFRDSPLARSEVEVPPASLGGL